MDIQKEKAFFGYCFDQAGRYGQPDRLVGASAAVAFMRRHIRTCSRIVVTDEEDETVMESVNGILVWPKQEGESDVPV